MSVIKTTFTPVVNHVGTTEKVMPKSPSSAATATTVVAEAKLGDLKHIVKDRPMVAKRLPTREGRQVAAAKAEAPAATLPAQVSKEEASKALVPFVKSATKAPQESNSKALVVFDKAAPKNVKKEPSSTALVVRQPSATKLDDAERVATPKPKVASEKKTSYIFEKVFKFGKLPPLKLVLEVTEEELIKAAVVVASVVIGLISSLVKGKQH
jgi:hypothetical protein